MGEPALGVTYGRARAGQPNAPVCFGPARRPYRVQPSMEKWTDRFLARHRGTRRQTDRQTASQPAGRPVQLDDERQLLLPSTQSSGSLSNLFNVIPLAEFLPPRDSMSIRLVSHQVIMFAQGTDNICDVRACASLTTCKQD